MKLPKAYATSLKKQTVDMTISINPIGCSPLVVQRLRAIRKSDVSTYPDQSRLILPICESLKVPPSYLLLGSGSEQLIKLISIALLKRGDFVSVEQGSFFLFSHEPQLTRANPQFFDMESPKKLRRKPSLLFIANPTTPGGIDRPNKKILEVIDTIKPVFAVVDEANGEFARESLVSQVRRRNDLIVLRTFSKALGLAGLRVGVAIGNPKLITRLNEFQQHFPVSSLSLIAAEVALSDRLFLKQTIAFIAAERKFLTNQLKNRGFGVSNSVTNNLFVTRNDSKRIIKELTERGVGVIDGAFFPGNTQPGFRISIRDKTTNRRFLEILDKVLACLNRTNLLRSKEVL